MIEFTPFHKISRLNREVIITEKIDGTNAQVYIGEDGTVLAGSRSRWITPENDNFGFAKWVQENKQELLTLGPGSHFGEWWGKGIQRGYGLSEKRFSLFNVTRWQDNPNLPKCCHLVPIIGRGIMSSDLVNASLKTLSIVGSVAAPGFYKPEGIVIFHTANGYLFKVTLENDETPKSTKVGYEAKA